MQLRKKVFFIHEITLLMIFSSIFFFWLYSIFSIRFIQEEPIHDFFPFTSHKVFNSSDMVQRYQSTKRCTSDNISFSHNPCKTHRHFHRS